MNENNLGPLERAINALPLHQPDEGVWAAIERDLDFDHKIRHAVPKLPSMMPEPETWTWVAESIALDEPAEQPAYWRKIALASLTSLFICIVSGILMPGRNGGVVTTETIVTQSAPPALTVFPLEFDTEKIVEQACLESPQSCSSPEALELKQQIASLDADIELLHQNIVKYGNDPDLVEDQVELENLKWKLTKQLLQALKS